MSADRLQDLASDTSESVDSNSYGHNSVPVKNGWFVS
jgi:hypothetical protein